HASRTRGAPAAAPARSSSAPDEPYPWRDRADYQESSPGTYLANALAATGAHVDGPKTGLSDGVSAHQRRGFETAQGLVRISGDPGSGLDSAAGWAVRPFRIT